MGVIVRVRITVRLTLMLRLGVRVIFSIMVIGPRVSVTVQGIDTRTKGYSVVVLERIMHTRPQLYV